MGNFGQEKGCQEVTAIVDEVRYERTKAEGVQTSRLFHCVLAEHEGLPQAPSGTMGYSVCIL